jgi:hypothetical protein
MITFDQTLDAVDRIYEHLKSVEQVGNQIDHVRANLNDFALMLEYAHKKEFKSTEEALQYIDKVLLPRLQGIITALVSGTEEPLKRLGTATEHTKRLLASLELVTGGASDALTR